MSCCLAETGSATRTSWTGIKAVTGSFETATGDAEWAATQTVHVAESSKPEWLWVAKATSDSNVSAKQSHATRFDIDRMYTFYTEKCFESTLKLGPGASRIRRFQKMPYQLPLLTISGPISEHLGIPKTCPPSSPEFVDSVHRNCPAYGFQKDLVLGNRLRSLGDYAWSTTVCQTECKGFVIQFCSRRCSLAVYRLEGSIFGAHFSGYPSYMDLMSSR
jgi:hypothetical protein